MDVIVSFHLQVYGSELKQVGSWEGPEASSWEVHKQLWHLQQASLSSQVLSRMSLLHFDFPGAEGFAVCMSPAFLLHQVPFTSLPPRHALATRVPAQVHIQTVSSVVTALARSFQLGSQAHAVRYD